MTLIDGAKRSLTLGRRCFLLGALSSLSARAMLRPRYGGTLRVRLPLAFYDLDPHVLDDPVAALFAPAVFDTLFALDAQGQPFPALAAGMPERVGSTTRVVLRPALRTALGRQLGAEDVVGSLERSARAGGMAWLSPLGMPRPDPTRADSILFPGADPKQLALTLSSPITAIVPRGFNRLRPDGTGAFRARPSTEGLILQRNDNAARGAALLDRVQALGASDLSHALRAFETGEADLGWLGKGLHRPRAGAQSFEAGGLGWIVLHSGALARDWGRPGVAQRLMDGLPAERLRHLGLRGLPPTSPAEGWGGPEGELLVDRASPQLIEIATLVTSLLSRPGHQLRPGLRSRQELRGARQTRQFLLMLDFVRRFGSSARAVTAAVYTAADPALARHVPRSAGDARTMARTLSLGVVGELHVYGAHVPQLVDFGSWDLGGCWFLQREG